MILALMLRPQVQEQMAPFDHWFYMTDHYQRIFALPWRPFTAPYSWRPWPVYATG